MNFVQPKKSFGQHFLTDQNIARKIVDNLEAKTGTVLEIGPGMGVLTQFLLRRNELRLHVMEIDRESVAYLTKNFPELQNIWFDDFLKADLSQKIKGPFSIIGNFPYNISSQILFKVFENHHMVPEVVGMFQKEVAERVVAKNGSKTYGITSVLLQAYYHMDYLFTVPEQVFLPPPKVKSAVIRLTRNQRQKLPCNEMQFVKVVKTAFNQRRKMLRNSLKVISTKIPERYAEKRPEQLTVDDFIALTTAIENAEKF